MAMANLLNSSSLISLRHPYPLLCPSLKTITPTRPRKPRSLIVQSKADNNDDGSQTDPADRLISAVTYFYPFFDGIHYGKYVITQFTPFQTLVQPLIPSIRAFNSVPFNGFLVFILLYFVVVRNPNFSRFVRFNTMQAIVLDTLLILPDLVVRGFDPKDGIGLNFVMSLNSTVFLYLLVCLVYGSGSCVFGQVPRLPIVADAAEQVM